MTNKKSNTKPSPKPQEVRSEEKKEVEQTKSVLTPEEDQAVQNAKVDQSSVNTNPQEGMDDSDDSKERIKEHDQLVKDIEDGKVNITGETLATDVSTIKKPLVPHPLSKKPVYESQEQWLKAEGAKGNL